MNQVAGHRQCSTLTELLTYRALCQPDKTAYRFIGNRGAEEARLTYAELDRYARALAAQLQASGTRGDRAILLYPPGLDFVIGFFGCVYAGMIAVPAAAPGPNRPLSRFVAIHRDSGARIVLTTAPVASIFAKRYAEVPELSCVRWHATDVQRDNDAPMWIDPDIAAGSLAFLQYTSGSTAAPKGVMVSHRNLLHNERAIEHFAGQDENSVFVSWLPLFHDMGLIGSILHTLYIGGSCVLMSPLTFLQRPISWLRTISAFRGTLSGAPNFAYDLCVSKTTPEERAGLDLSSWTIAFNGAEPVRYKTLESFARTFEPCGFSARSLCPCYGLAEATLIVSGQRVELDEDSGRDGGRSLVSCGHTALDMSVRIVDPESRALVPDGEIGEIWIDGPSVAQGYWSRDEETERTFRACIPDSNEGPFLRTGDLGYVSGGRLVIAGRLKDMIIMNGRNIYPTDIEQTVEGCHPAMRRNGGGAFAVETADEERLVIVQEVDTRQAEDLDELVGTVRQAVSEQHEIPVHAVVLLRPGSFPRTTSGKLQRWLCRERLLSGDLPGVILWRGSPSGTAQAAAEVSMSQAVAAASKD